VLVRVNFPPFFTEISHEGFPFLESSTETEGTFNLTVPDPATGDTTFAITVAASDTHVKGTHHIGRPEIEVKESENGRIGKYQMILNDALYSADGQGEDPVTFVTPVVNDNTGFGAIHSGLNLIRITVFDEPNVDIGVPRKAQFELRLFVSFEGLTTVFQAQ